MVWLIFDRGLVVVVVIWLCCDLIAAGRGGYSSLYPDPRASLQLHNCQSAISIQGLSVTHPTQRRHNTCTCSINNASTTHARSTRVEKPARPWLHAGPPHPGSSQVQPPLAANQVPLQPIRARFPGQASQSDLRGRAKAGLPAPAPAMRAECKRWASGRVVA